MNLIRREINNKNSSNTVTITNPISSSIPTITNPTLVALIASLGSALEYYDFIVYGMMVKYLTVLFFPFSYKFSGALLSFSVFTIGYFARPLGAVIFGLMADTYGRKVTFVGIMLTMGMATTLIGLLPVYEKVGLVSTIALIFLRIIQGISYGAELPAAATIVKECSEKAKLGKFCSIMLSGTSFGSLLATLVLFLLTSYYSDHQIYHFYWRVPFLLGGALALVSIYARLSLKETPEFLEKRNDIARSLATPLRIIFSNYLRPILVGVLLMILVAVLIVMNLYFPYYLNKHYNYSMSDIYRAMTISMLASGFYMLLLAQIAHKLKKEKVIVFTVILAMAIFYPLLKLIDAQTYVSLLIFFLVYQFIISLYFTSCLPIVTELFPTNVRSTGVGIVYNISFMLASMLPAIWTLFSA